MKLKKILLIGIFLLVLLTIGSISASEINETGIDVESQINEEFVKFKNIETDKITLDEENIVDDINSEPNITVPSKIWKYGENEITIDSNEKSYVNITGAITYNEELSIGKTSIPLNNLSTGFHNIFINYLSNTVNFQKAYNITVLKENPNWDMNFDLLESEILYGPPWDHELIDSQIVIHNMPEGLAGNFSFYVNNNLVGTYTAQYLLEEEIYYGEYYEEKIYNFTLKYSGDDYFNPISKTKITEFCPILIKIPKEVILGHENIIYIYSDYDKKGNIQIKINNKTIFKKENVNINYAFEYKLNQLKAGQQYFIEVIFSNNNINKITKATVNVNDHITNYVSFGEHYNKKYTYNDKSNIYYINSPKLNLTILIDNKKVKTTYEDNWYMVNIHNLTPGTHLITVSYNGDEKYAKKTFSNKFEVVVKAKCPSEVKQNDLKYLTLDLPNDAIGNFTFLFENKDNSSFKSYKTIEVNNSKVSIALPTNHVGHYQLNAYFNGNYELNEITGKYLVKDSAIWKLNNNFWNLNLNEKYILTLKMPKDGFGNLSVNVKKNGKPYDNFTIEVTNGTCKITLPTNHIGKYSIITSFNGNYELLPYETNYEVDPEYYITIIDEYNDLKYNSNDFVYIELPKNGTGTLTLEIKYNEKDNYTVYESVELDNGKASIQFPTNKVGNIYYNIFYNGNYEIYNSTGQKATVIPTYSFNNNIFTLIANNELNGTFIINDWSTDKTFTQKIVNGHASIDLTNYLKQINKRSEFYLSFISHDEEEKYMGYKYVYPNVKVVAKDINMYYGSYNMFKAKIYKNDKAVGKGEKITVTIGFKKYSLKTDKNGIIKLKITQTPKKYTIKTTYNGKTFKNKLIVKQVLILKNIKVKKSAKKLILQATLKNKKPLKNKLITFKFNEKTYKAKTNSKGIAKVTLESSILKKLKTDKITYQATYLKNTVKKTVKIQK